MALIKCKECGKEFSDKATACPNCGCPIEQARPDAEVATQNDDLTNIQSQPVNNIPVNQGPTTNIKYANNEKSTKKKESPLGIAGLILSFIFCIPIFPLAGLIMCIIAVSNKTKKSTCAKIGIVISIITLIISCNIWSNDSENEKESSSAAAEESVNSSSTSAQKEKQEKTPEPNKEPTPTISKEDFISSCIEIPYKNLARNPDDYVGEHIVLTVKVTQVMQGGLFDSNEYYRVYTNDEYDMWLGDEYFMYDDRVENDMKLLQDDIIKVYGEFSGTTTVTRALTGTKEDVPAFKAVYVELLEENDIAQVNEEILNDGTIDIDFGDFSVQYESYELATDYEKNPCIIVYFNFTNNSTESKNAGYSTHLKVFQDGVECDSAIIFEDNKYIDNYYKDITSGTTIKFGQAYVLNSENEILLEMSESFSLNGTKDSMSISFE